MKISQHRNLARYGVSKLHATIITMIFILSISNLANAQYKLPFKEIGPTPEDWKKSHAEGISNWRQAQAAENQIRKNTRQSKIFKSHLLDNNEIVRLSDNFFGDWRVWTSSVNKVIGRLSRVKNGRVSVIALVDQNGDGAYSTDEIVILTEKINLLSNADTTYLGLYIEWDKQPFKNRIQWIVDYKARIAKLFDKDATMLRDAFDKIKPGITTEPQITKLIGTRPVDVSKRTKQVNKPETYYARWAALNSKDKTVYLEVSFENNFLNNAQLIVDD